MRYLICYDAAWVNKTCGCIPDSRPFGSAQGRLFAKNAKDGTPTVLLMLAGSKTWATGRAVCGEEGAESGANGENGPIDERAARSVSGDAGPGHEEDWERGAVGRSECSISADGAGADAGSASEDPRPQGQG